MKRSLILTVFSFLMLAQLGWGQVPQTISYQGMLRHPDGTLVPAAGGDTTATITFSLYDAATPTLPVWTETQSVLVSDGLFSVILGKATPFTGILSPPVELGITVGADAEMIPRIELTSVIYALHADRSDSSEYAQKAGEVSGTSNVFPGSGYVGIGTTNPNNRLHINSASSTVTNLQITNSSSGSTGADGLRIGFVGSNEAYVWNNENSGLVFGTNNIEQMSILNTGNVGIGTTSPSQKLDVNGTVLANGFALNNLNTKISSLTTNNIDLITSNAVRVRIDPSGNVGIGTTAPSVKLDVAGDVKANSLTLPATMRYYSISPAAFNPSDNSTGFVRSYETIYSTMATGDVDFYAPANLPHGAVIKEMVAAFIDNHATETIVFDLRRMSLNSTGSDIIARCVSSGSSVAIQTVTESATTTVATVDNSSYTYVIHTYWFAPTIATDITVRSVKIVYEVTTPLP